MISDYPIYKEYYDVSHFSTEVVTAPDGNTFQLSSPAGKFGLSILRNGKKDAKWNEGIDLFKVRDNVFYVDNNGSMFDWNKGQWNYFVKDKKIESDIFLTWFGRNTLFGTTVQQMQDYLKKTVPHPAGTYYTDFEYLVAKNGAPTIPANIAGAFMDMATGMPYYEANAKWGTTVREQTKGGLLKVLGGVVAGFAAGGPIGAVIGGIGAGIAEYKAVKDKQAESKALTKEVSNTVAEVKKIQEQQKAAAAANAAGSVNPNLLASGTDLKSLVSNPYIIGAILLALVGVMFLVKK